MSLKKWLPVIVITGFVILLDQIAKWWIVSNLSIGETVPLLEGLQPYLQITRTTNTGFAFGLASGGNLIILVLSSLITVGLLWMVYQLNETQRLQLVALAMIIGGASGNIIDRIRFSHVVDFVHIYIPDLISNVSNFADHFVVIGVGLLLIDSFLQEQGQKKNDSPATSEIVNQDV